MEEERDSDKSVSDSSNMSFGIVIDCIWETSFSERFRLVKLRPLSSLSTVPIGTPMFPIIFLSRPLLILLLCLCCNSLISLLNTFVPGPPVTTARLSTIPEPLTLNGPNPYAV